MPTTIWIDGDACPGAVKEIALRASERLRVPIVFVANKLLRLPTSPLVRSVRVDAGPDVADSHIVTESAPGDLVVTADIPLAALLVKKGVIAIDPRGTRYDDENIAERLSVRDLMAGLRDSGEITGGGPSAFDARAKQRFASTFDACLTRAMKG